MGYSFIGMAKTAVNCFTIAAITFPPSTTANFLHKEPSLHTYNTEQKR